jgi:hypothetical protein
MPDLHLYIVSQNDPSPKEMEQRVLRICNDARILARTMTGAQVEPVALILEQARDDLSRVLERGGGWR